MSVFKENPVIPQNHVRDLLFEQVKPRSEDFNPVYEKLLRKSINDDTWRLANKCLYKDKDVLDVNAVKHITNGFSIENVTLYERFQEAIIYLATYVSDIWTNIDFTHILNLCYVNEKFVFILIYPYVLKPLGEIIWPTLLPHFHFVKGSFTIFIQKVSNTLYKSTVLFHKYQTLSVRKSAKLALGISGAGFIAYLGSYFTTNVKQGLASNSKIYKGLSGSLSHSMKLLRQEGSKVIYEVFRTLSTFSNAAISGALEPKQEAISKVLKTPAVTDIIKNIKK